MHSTGGNQHLANARAAAALWGLCLLNNQQVERILSTKFSPTKLSVELFAAMARSFHKIKASDKFKHLIYMT